MPKCNGLSARQQRFVQEYVVDLNATQAAIRSGYSAKTAHVIGGENLRKPAVAADVQKLLDAQSRTTAITKETVVQEAWRLFLAAKDSEQYTAARSSLELV